MGVINHLDITGAKGGESKPKAPVEAPDSLQSTNIAKILLAVGEGEFDGVPTDRDIYLDNTPITDANGNVNFPGVKWEWRRGNIEQDYIQGIPAVESETSVGVELRSDAPFTRALNDPQLSAVRVRLAWPRLLRQDASGNTNGYRIEYAIDIASDGGAYVEAHRGAVEGKTSNGYQRSVRVNLPKATSGWMLRVRRLTANANTGTIADTMSVAGYTEIIDQKLRYPNTALLYVEFDAQQFQNIPAVSVRCKAKRWPVPSNYDPLARTYDGVWDGTFKQAWTNNPALVTYGLCVEDRFGLGKRIKPWMVDKWEMYRIAQYCDQPVPDGIGGQEPRFLCDLNLQGRADAWTLLRDLSAIYRGMVYWAHGALFMQADMPRAQDVDYVFTRANVIDGDFVYGGAERSSHYSRALVSYDNPANNYDTDVIPVTDLALQRRYRDRPVEISAIGCTRASEAQRRGKWALLSNHQDRTVTFKTGMEGRIPLPGYVIPVADELVAGRPNGGRIAAAAGRTITLDRDTEIQAGDRLIVNLPNGTAQARTVQAVQGREVTVTTAYDVAPEPQLQWAIDHQDLAIQLFRVLKTSRTQEGHYEITALEFNPSKFAAIDTGAKLDERPISVIPVTTVQAPANVVLSSSHMVDQGIAVNTMTIAWDAVQGAVGYDVEWRKDNGNWVRLQRTGTTSVDVIGIYAGAYLARVRAVSAFDASSAWKSSALTSLNGKAGNPPAITSLTTESLLFGIGLKWTFPPGAEDTQRTELWYGEGTDLTKATKLADLAYPQDKHTLQGLRAGQRFYFWARLVDRSGNLGPWYPLEATLVSGQASADAGPILEQIAQQIGESELGKELTSKIEKIALIDGNGPGSVNERVGSAKTELAKQIGDVNNALSGVKSTLEGQLSTVSKTVTDAKTDLQQQIANVSALAGSLPYRKDKAYSTSQSALGADGKLYQATKAVPLNTPPPNVDYWTDVGQAVVTATGTAARVSKLETDVSTLDGKSTAQASQLSGLQTSLTATNGNVSAAQTAADAANALAGGKGKVLIQAAAPATADRLAQNLWIDTTGNANTPKRWTGSAWAAVTDKAATDAAAAAAGALALAQTKADASVVSSLTTRVSDAEGKLTSQATRLDGMQTSIDGKASSQALQQVTSRVTATEQKDAAQDQQLTSQSQALTSLKDSVDKKADSSAVQSLSNEVRQQGQTLTSQGQSLTRIDTSLGNLGASGINLVPADFSVFTKDLPAAMYSNGGVALSTVADASCFKGYALKADNSNETSHTIGLATSFTAAGCNMGFKPGKYLVSFRARAQTAGHVIGCYARVLLTDGVNFKTSGAPLFTLTTAWARYSAVIDLPAADFAGTQMQLAIQSNRSGIANRITFFDQFMLEAVANNQTEPSIFNLGDSFDQAAANAVATTSLSARVEKTEQGQISTSQQVTQLDNSLRALDSKVGGKADAAAMQVLANNVEQQGKGITANSQSLTKVNASLSNLGASGVNLVPAEYCAFAKDLPAGMYSNAGVAMSTVADAAAFKGYALRADSRSADSHTFGLNAGFTAAGCNMGFKSGKYLVSFYARSEVAGHIVGAYARVLLADGSSFKTSNSPTFTLTTSWARYVGVIDLTDPSYNGTQMQLAIQSNRSGIANRVTYYDRFMFEAAVNDQSEPSNFSMGDSFDQSQVNALATTALTGRVDKAESGVTSVSGQLTELNNSLGDVGGENLLYNPSFNKYASLNGWAEGWESEGPASSVDTLVPSWMNSAEKAQRIVAQGLNTSSAYKSLRTTGVKRITVAGGQAVTASAYVRRGSDPVSMRIFIQWMSASDSVISAPASAMTPLTVAGDRIQFSALAPADAVKAYVYYRAYGPSSSATPATFEIARPQVEYGAKATGWRDNGQVASSAIGAVSTAVDGLTSSVNQQGKDITSVSSRTTSLENSVNNGSTGLASKASAAALNTVAIRVAATESGLTAQSSSITNLEAKIGNAQPFVAGQTWEFTNSTEGWKANTSGATLTAGPQYATVAKLTNIQVTNTFPVIEGAENPLIRIRLRRRNTGRTNAAMYWANEDGGLAEARRFNWPINTSNGDWQDIEFDLSGHAGWNGKKIWAIRLDMYNSNDANGEVDIAYIAAGRRSVAASGRAFDSLSVNVTQQSDRLAAETQRINGLLTSVGNANAAIQSEASTRSTGDTALSRRIDTVQSSVGSANASIQSEAQARASADTALGQRVDTVQSNLGDARASVQQVATAQTGMKNMLNAQYTMRVQINNQYGVHHWGGFGIGINEQGGVVQSAFVIYADQFVLLNSNGAGLSSPFSVVGGQTFIADAYIRDASIGAAKIQDAAVNNAKIANGAITAAKIGTAEVDTLRIRGNAVTVPTVANNPSHAAGAGVNAWIDLIAVAIQMDDPGYIMAQFGCYQGFGSGIRRYMFQMLINDSVVAEGGGDWADGFPSLLSSMYAGPGAYVIKVRWWGENTGVGVRNMNLFAMGCKR
ncbi:DUF1983 domain-containing protein [Pseudomonas sp.]|uniref:TipJ family phage tail tip protein n=1 Tax=Pseudomonas sp. TaxID=306 RepID=UPI0039182833